MDTHPMATMTLLYRKHQLGSMYILDNWPFLSQRQLVINDPVCPRPIGERRTCSVWEGVLTLQ
jgi:hypothetical protein